MTRRKYVFFLIKYFPVYFLIKHVGIRFMDFLQLFIQPVRKVLIKVKVLFLTLYFIYKLKTKHSSSFVEYYSYIDYMHSRGEDISTLLEFYEER